LISPSAASLLRDYAHMTFTFDLKTPSQLTTITSNISDNLYLLSQLSVLS